MCNFLSAIVLRNGDVLTHPLLDSHTDLVTYFRLPDTTAYHQHFAKVELVPVDWMDPATWEFRLDEESAPAWWEEIAGRAERMLRDRASRLILRDGEHRLIVDGCWVVGGTAVVRDVRAGRIVHVRDSAQIYDVWDTAQIRGVRDSAQIHGVGGAAQIHDVGDTAQIRGVRGAAQIHHVGGTAQIYDVRDSAQIYDVRDSAQIHRVRDSAQIRGVGGAAQIHGVGGAAQIHHVGDSAQIRGVGDSAQLDESARARVVTP